jgi:hypothetical protein
LLIEKISSRADRFRLPIVQQARDGGVIHAPRGSIVVNLPVEGCAART